MSLLLLALVSLGFLTLCVLAGALLGYLETKLDQL
jgi:hypothetical protein